jgi:basic membrane protein A
MAQERLLKRIRSPLAGMMLMLAVLDLSACAILPNQPSEPPNCQKAAVFCAGLVTDAGGLQDGGLNQQTWDGIRRSKVMDWAQYLESQSTQDYSKNIAFFAETGYDVIITVGGQAAEATVKAAEQYPEIYFIGVDQYQEIPRENLAGLIFPEDQAGFLAGVLAAQISRTGQVGAVCSSDAIPTYWRYCQGFQAGADYLDPEIKAEVLYNDAYSLERAVNDPSWAMETANQMITGGVDVLFADPTETGLAALKAAAEVRVYSIGSGVDQYQNLPEARPYLLTSVMPLVTPGILALIRFASAEQAGRAVFPAGNYSGGVGYAPFYDKPEFVTMDMQVKLEEIRIALAESHLKTGVPAVMP